MENEIKKILTKLPHDARLALMGYNYALANQDGDEARVVLCALLGDKRITGIGVDKENIHLIASMINMNQNIDMAIGDFVSLIDEISEKQLFLEHYINLYKFPKDVVRQSRTLFFDMCDVYQEKIMQKAL